MASLTELDVVNDCLSTMGELPVNSLDDDHDLVAAARRAFRTSMIREQGKEWWYNAETVTLSRDADGYIFTPGDAIRCDPAEQTSQFVQRGRRLYDVNNATYKMPFEKVVCFIVRLVPFEDLPPSAQIAIGVATQLKFMVAYDADSTKYRQLITEYQEAYMTMNAEHMRNSDSNLLETGSIAGKIARVRGYGVRRLITPR